MHLSGYVMPEDEFPELNDDVTDSDIEEKEEEEVESDEETSPPCTVLIIQLFVFL